MKISLLIILVCIAAGLSACVVEPHGGARAYYPKNQRAPHDSQPDQGHRVWRP